MLPVSKSFKSYLLALTLALFAFNAGAQQIVYDLRQDWVYFEEEHQGFLPVEEQDFYNKVISFKLSDSEFDQFYLTIGVHHKAFLFYRTKLLATIPAGVSSFRIDSLKQIINDNEPFLSLYGDNLLPELHTEIRTKYMSSTEVSPYQPIRYMNDFSNFFYLATTLIVLLFVILRVRYAELTDQYLLLQRTFRIKTIDELIYKIQYLGYPNNLFLVFLSLMLSLLLISFMYFYPGELNFLNINPEASSFTTLIKSWLLLFGIILVLLVVKFFITRLTASIFALKIGNIHYASSLRFIMVLSMAMLALTLFQVLMIGVIPETIFWLLFVLAMVIMEVILFFKLTLVTSHTLLYIIVYLCATEIIPIVFLYELVTI